MSGTIKKIYNTVTTALDINQSFLSGSIDIIVAEQTNGNLKSTPFHIRFGKFKALRGRDCQIDIFINGQKTDVFMKLGRAGEGYFDLSQFKKEKTSFNSQNNTDDAISERDQEQQPKWKWIWGQIPQKEKQKQIEQDHDAGLLTHLKGILKKKNLEEAKAQKNFNNPLDEELQFQQYQQHQINQLQITNIEKQQNQQTNLSFNTNQSIHGSNQIKSPKSENNLQTNDEIEVSLCSHLIQQNMTNEQKQQIFNQNIISYDQFITYPFKYINNNQLVFKIGDYTFSSEVGMCMLFSKIIYGKDQSVHQLLQWEKTHIEGKKSIWNRWFKSKNIQENKETKQEETKTKDIERNFKEDSTNSKTRKSSEEVNLSDHSSTNKPQKKIKLSHCLKSLKPTSEMLKKLNLNYGANTITFKVKTDLQGIREQTANIFLWKPDTHIIVTDVDGTITKSDVFGQLMPAIGGTEWNHPGVTKFFRELHNNGYQILYLTARGIGQSEQTKEFIHNLKQNHIQLPLGPVIMSPDRLLPSFRREIIDKKPEVFKIQALKDVKNIFEPPETLFAAFGNRENDALSYQTVGINENRIFIIDTESNIHLINKNMTTNYDKLTEEMNIFFPLCSNLNNDQFNQSQYWSLPLITQDINQITQIEQDKLFT